MARKILVGKIVSNKMQKTVVVEIERRIRHPIYGKIVKKTKRIKADDNGFKVEVGESVKIEQTRPISRDKYFKVIEILEQRTALARKPRPASPRGEPAKGGK